MVDLSRVKVTQTLMIAAISSVRSYLLTCMENTVSFITVVFVCLLNYSCVNTLKQHEL